MRQVREVGAEGERRERVDRLGDEHAAGPKLPRRQLERADEHARRQMLDDLPHEDAAEGGVLEALEVLDEIGLLDVETVAAQPAAAAFPDYFAFEAQMRGSTGSVRERQRIYVDDLREAAPVLDVGCGRGELLGLLRDAGIEARGVDADADMAAYARGEGLEVEQADALAHLEQLPDATLGGIFAGQVVEHLPPAALFRLLELAARKLRPGGLLVAETINPLSPLALRSYFADLTHAQPLVPETLELLAKQAGFRTIETRFLNAPRHADDVDERIREILFAPLDYAIVAST